MTTSTIKFDILCSYVILLVPVTYCIPPAVIIVDFLDQALISKYTPLLIRSTNHSLFIIICSPYYTSNLVAHIHWFEAIISFYDKTPIGWWFDFITVERRISLQKFPKWYSSANLICVIVLWKVSLNWKGMLAFLTSLFPGITFSQILCWTWLTSFVIMKLTDFFVM